MRNEEDKFARTTTADLKTVAEDMLRMGRHWARAAQDWLERSGEAAGRQWTRGRSDRDLQSDYSGGGYDQVAAGVRNYQGVGPRNYTRSDERVREDLNERLTEAYDLDASDITVEVENGIATLGGKVDQRWMKHRAEDLADGCPGVRDVRNRIQVRGANSGKTTSGIHAGTTGQAGSTGKETP
jgi:hypothetical protein